MNDVWEKRKKELRVLEEKLSKGEIQLNSLCGVVLVIMERRLKGGE